MRDTATQKRFLSIVLGAAIFIAPFLALLFGLEAGLLLMSVALAATALLLRDSITGAPTFAHRWLRILVAFNLALAVACVIALVVIISMN